MTVIITITGISESPAPAPGSRLQIPELPSDTGPGPVLRDFEGFHQGVSQPLTTHGFRLSSNPLSLDGRGRPTGAEAFRATSSQPSGAGRPPASWSPLPALGEQRGQQQLGKVPGPCRRGSDSELGWAAMCHQNCADQPGGAPARGGVRVGL